MVFLSSSQRPQARVQPEFKRTDGDVAVKAPEKAVVFVSWGELEKVMKKAPTIEDHAKFSLDRVKKSVQGKMTPLDHKEIDVNGHTAVVQPREDGGAQAGSLREGDRSRR